LRVEFSNDDFGGKADGEDAVRTAAGTAALLLTSYV
jgi:hypothetical protein